MACLPSKYSILWSLTIDSMMVFTTLVGYYTEQEDLPYITRTDGFISSQSRINGECSSSDVLFSNRH